VPGAPDLSDRFPAQSRVCVQFKDKKSYNGTVLRTFVTRPRKEGVLPQRRIVVHYDDPKWQHETFEHNVDESSISLIPSPSDSRDARRATREARLNRQLA